MIKVIVVDDHPVVVEGLKQVIAQHTEMAVTGEAGDGLEALNVIRSIPCDVVLLDLTIPKKNGLEVLKEVRAESPRLPVLVVSAYSPEEHAARCIRAGASGFLKKETAIEEVVQAIRKVVQGGLYMSEDFANKLAGGELQTDLCRTLSNRERQVLRRMCSGKTITEIAAELNLSVKTISTYRTRLLEKLMLENTAQLVRYGITKGLADEEPSAVIVQ